MPRERSRYRENRDRRSSSYSSETSDRKRSKTKHKRRSRSRDRSQSRNHRSKHSSTRTKYKRRSYSRSTSRDRRETRSRRRSTSRCRSKPTKRAHRSRSRSSTRSHSKHSKSSKRHNKRSSSLENQSNSFDIEPRNANRDDAETKVEKAIKAAAAAGVTLAKIPTYDYNKIEIKEEMPTIQDRNVLDEINSESFVQKSFTSSKKQAQNIVIDLDAETIKIPQAETKIKIDDSIINFDEIPSHEELKEMWIRKLYQYRRKILKEETNAM